MNKFAFWVWFRLIWVGFFLIVLTLCMGPIQWLATRLNLSLKHKLPIWWHKLIRRVLWLNVKVEGKLHDKRPLLIVANHQTWLDIVVLSSVFEACFISKSEVETWPGFGLLARLQRTVFVNRNRRSTTGQTADAISQRMIEGDVMILFAEGTTGDGNRILPFKSSLFGAAQLAAKDANVENVAVQPVVVTYTHIRGSLVSRSERKRISWYGDLDLIPHILDYLSMGPVEARIICCDAMEMSATTNRKELSINCQKIMDETFCHIYYPKMLDRNENDG